MKPEEMSAHDLDVRNAYEKYDLVLKQHPNTTCRALHSSPKPPNGPQGEGNLWVFSF